MNWRYLIGSVSLFNLMPALAIAGPMFAVGPRWQMFSTAASTTADSPNYFGLGGDLSLGYSIDQVFDLAGWANYVPMSLKNTEAGRDDALVFAYGGAAGVRFANSFYLGGRYGTQHYQMIALQKDSEVDGRWSGSGAGLVLAAISPLSNNHFVQIQIDYMRTKMTRRDSIEELNDAKLFDTFGVSLLLVLNHQNNQIGSAFFRSFMGN